MSVIAYATGIEPFLGGAVLNESVASHFPGASVWPVAKRVANDRGWQFSTADVVLDQMRSGDIQASDVRVVQEEDAALGTALIQAGAQAALLLCGESPLFARDFYCQLDNFSRGFENALLFRGALNNLSSPTQGHVLHFPGFHRGSYIPVRPWRSRDEVALVAGNKYWRHGGLPIFQRMQREWQMIKDRSYYEWLRAHQLHDRRLAYVVGLYEAGLLTLFGGGWDVSHHLPASWRNELARARVRGQALGPTEKQSTISSFKFTLAMENFEYPGYVTEKIINALAAGSIPLYLGAPDIEDFIPADVFVDLRGFASPEDLAAYLATIDEQTGLEMIKRGQEFLSSEAGDVFSYERQGELIVDIAIQ